MEDNKEESVKQERKKCGACRVNLPIKHFKMKRDETLTAHCIKCLDNAKKMREKKASASMINESASKNT